MLNPSPRWLAFEREDERASAPRSFEEALARFEALWRFARSVRPDLGEDWRADLGPDFAVARAINGLPPAA
jgi:hypothetical protein